MITDEDLRWEEINAPYSKRPKNFTRSNEDDTSVCWNYQDRTVEIFTNRRSVYERCIECNSTTLQRTEDDVNRVYTLEYSFDEIRAPELILKKHRSPVSRGLNEPVGL